LKREPLFEPPSSLEERQQQSFYWFELYNKKFLETWLAVATPYIFPNTATPPSADELLLSFLQKEIGGSMDSRRLKLYSPSLKISDVHASMLKDLLSQTDNNALASHPEFPQDPNVITQWITACSMYMEVYKTYAQSQ
jgi:hypothetical protein